MPALFMLCFSSLLQCLGQSRNQYFLTLRSSLLDKDCIKHFLSVSLSMTTLLGRHHDDLFSDEGTVAQGVSRSLTYSHIPAISRGRTGFISAFLSAPHPLTSTRVSFLLLQ